MATPGEPPPVRRKSILEFLPASMGGGSTETKRGTSVAPELEEKGNAVPASSGKGGLPPPKRGGDRRDPGYISRDTRRWLKYELEADTDDDLRQAQEEHAEAERRKQQSQSNEAAGGWKKKLFYRFDSWVSKRLNQSIFLAMTLFAFQIIFGILWLTVAWDDEVSAAGGGCGASSGWVCRVGRGTMVHTRMAFHLPSLPHKLTANGFLARRITPTSSRSRHMLPRQVLSIVLLVPPTASTPLPK